MTAEAAGSAAKTRSRKPKDLGQILVDQGVITAKDLERALQERAKKGQLLGRVLVDLGMVKESDLVSALARQIGLRFVDLSDANIEPGAAALLPEQVAKRYKALPIGYEDSKLIVAMADPANLFALDDIRTITGTEVLPVVATAADIEAAIRKYSRFDQSVEALGAEAAEAADGDLLDATKGEVAVEEGPIIKMVNLLITQAIGDRASDIHIEPTERDVRVRFRVDGVLHEVMRSPKNIQAGLISRMKVMADMNIAERRIPQDGRVGLTVGGKQIDLRVAVLPTVYGEKIVIRILDKTGVLLKLSEIGFLEDTFLQYERSFLRPYGAILVTGPTGSGKSTTLYATLNIINKPDRNIITVEDPVEYRLPGINQMQINNRAGLTFAAALRSILRADPDIILIGEIRDRETGLIAIEAALTGHLVLSTLHTNDAASAPPRLIEMGVEAYLVASAIDCVVAQRLARKLCVRCREAYKPDKGELAEAGFPDYMIDGIKELFRPVGCPVCSKTGYRGRLGIMEVLTKSEDIERLIVDRVSSEEIKRVARREGMITLREDGMEKVRQGVTSVEEVLRVVA
jgi:type IV pilus assembly protein PilB